MEGEIIYPEGARYPVTYDETPKGLSTNMNVFRKKR